MNDRFFRAPGEDELTSSPAPAGRSADAAPQNVNAAGQGAAASPRKPAAGETEKLPNRNKQFRNSAGFLDLLSTHFLICNERIKGSGEDSGYECYTAEAGVLGAFDGCGGTGAQTCFAASNKTEAYLASRAVKNAVQDWFRMAESSGYEWDLDLLKRMIIKYLGICRRYAGQTQSKLRGSLVRSFPSTIALIACKITDGDLVTDHIWAGDSRTYCLDRRGLAQISVDDVHGEDAMSNLSKDGALTNVLSADGNFTLHRMRVKPELPCILFSSSDGCFGYVPSPMEFELMILSGMMSAKNVVEWRSILDREIEARAGDDQTFAMAAFGFDSFQEMKDCYQERFTFMQKVVQSFRDSDETVKNRLWDRYKQDYYRFYSDKS